MGIIAHPRKRRMDVAVYNPLDRAGAVIDYGPHHGQEIQLVIACEGTAEVERLRALTAYRGVCLLGSPFDDAPQPVAVTDVGIEPAGTSEDPFVRATLALIPVGLA